MRSRRRFRTGDGLAFRRTGQYDAGEPHQILARFRFKLPPEFISANGERNVIGMFEIGFANDAGFAVRTAPVVGDAELLDAQNLYAAFRQMIKRPAPKPAHADDDDIKTFHTDQATKQNRAREGKRLTTKHT